MKRLQARKEAKQRLIKALHGNWPDVIQIEFCLQYLRHHLNSSWGIIAYLVRREVKLWWACQKIRFIPKNRKMLKDLIEQSQEANNEQV